MVGTDILQGLAEADQEPEEGSKEFGFYTELEEVVMVYKGLAHALIKQAERELASQHKLPHYKEDSRSGAAAA